jgi:uncharacterized protein
MTDTVTTAANKPTWVDLAAKDPAAARDFYTKVFGWDVEVNPDPQYGGYALARVAGRDVAGIGGMMTPDQPSAWSVYIATDDAEDLGRRVEAAGGKVVMPAFDVGEQGRMAVFQDPSGAFISAWQGTRMGGFQTEGANTFSWAELNSRDLERAVPFYEDVFGWTSNRMTGGPMPYVEFQIDGERIAGATEIGQMVPPDVPSYWLAYFEADDVDETFGRAVGAGARVIVAPMDFPGGRFAIVGDPQAAVFGIVRTATE